MSCFSFFMLFLLLCGEPWKNNVKRSAFWMLRVIKILNPYNKKAHVT
jgi:tRNA(His) 5'-end guanylyltransferase